MLKKIPVSQLRPGMHVHKLEGSWISHPFWKTRFTIAGAGELAELQGSGVAECWIDPSLGLDAGVAAPAPAAPAAPVKPAAAPPTAPTQPARSSEAEMRLAVAICERGREAVTAMFAEARMGRIVDVESCLPLVEEIAQSVQRNPGALVSLARLKTRDDYSYMHSVAVCALMVSLGKQLGMDEVGCRIAGIAGLMHDIGKALMPVELLNKPGRLSDAEFEIIRAHPERGHALLLESAGTTEQTLDVVLHHHERVDGRGYPHGLAGEQITELARMGAICDVYDAITSNRPYKTGWDPAESIAAMASWKGQFDDALFGAFVQSLGIYPTGSLVRLESGRLAVVIEQNPHNLVAPVVKVFFSTRMQLHVTPQRLDLAARGCSERIVGREAKSGSGLQFQHLEQIWVDPDILRRMQFNVT